MKYMKIVYPKSGEEKDIEIKDILGSGALADVKLVYLKNSADTQTQVLKIFKKIPPNLQITKSDTGVNMQVSILRFNEEFSFMLPVEILMSDQGPKVYWQYFKEQLTTNPYWNSKLRQQSIASLNGFWQKILLTQDLQILVQKMEDDLDSSSNSIDVLVNNLEVDGVFDSDTNLEKKLKYNVLKNIVKKFWIAH